MSFVLLLAAGIVVGGWLIGPFRFRDRAESLVYRLLAGLIVCAVAILIIGSDSLRAAQVVINGLALFGLGYELFRTLRASALPDSLETPRQPLSFIEWVSLAAMGGALAMALISALAPATGWDACVAHLALPKDYVREGRIELFEGNEYSAYPHLLHCLFTYAFLQGGERGVMLLSWTFALMACVVVFDLGRRIEGRKCGLIAAAILATAPIFLDQGGTASVDLAFCTFAMAAMACLVAWHDERRPFWLFLSALFAGSSCGIRHTGYVVCLLLAITMLFMTRPDGARAAFWFGVAAFISALPWLARSAWLVGDPFYPFFADAIGSGRIPHWDVTSIGSHSTLKDTGLLRLLMFPWDIIMKPHLFDGWTKSPGGLVLLLGIPGLFVGGKRARGLGAFALAGLICFFYFERLARYLLPFFVPMMVVAAIAACRMKGLRYVIGPVLAVMFLYGLTLDAGAVHFKIPVVLGIEETDQYLKERVERYPAFQWVNGHIPLNELALTFDRRTYYFRGRTFQNDEPLRRIRNLPLSSQVDWLKAHDVRWVFLPITYIEESPGCRDAFLSMVTVWRHARRNFIPAHTFDLMRPRGPGMERVEVFEVRYDEPPVEGRGGEAP
jgi:hypothetical protein